MKTRKTGKRQEGNKEVGPDETDFEEMLERYTMVPPLPFTKERKRKRIMKKAPVQNKNS